MAPEPTGELHFTRQWMQAQPAVASALQVLVRDPHLVDDLLQEVAFAAYQAFAGYDPGRSFTGWALGIARHKAIDWMRREGGRRLTLVDEQALEALAASAERLAGELGDRELALHHCLAVLGERAKQVLRLRYAEDLDVAGIAAEMRLQGNHIKVLLHRAREALRTCIERRLEALTQGAQP